MKNISPGPYFLNFMHGTPRLNKLLSKQPATIKYYQLSEPFSIRMPHFIFQIILRYDIILIQEIRSTDDDAINELLEGVNR